MTNKEKCWCGKDLHNGIDGPHCPACDREERDEPKGECVVCRCPMETFGDACPNCKVGNF